MLKLSPTTKVTLTSSRVSPFNLQPITNRSTTSSLWDILATSSALNPSRSLLYNVTKSLSHTSVPHARAQTIQQLILVACLTQGSQPDLAFASKGHDAHVAH